MMNNKDTALMTTKLHVPLLVRDILEGNVSYDAGYDLHAMISDMQPDAAILTMALSIRQICQSLPQDNFIPTLNMACDRIINDYGPCWLAHANDKDVDTIYLMDLLTHLPEDFETLSEFIDLVMAYVPEDSATYDILETLSIQANAHSLIAETFLEAIDDQHKIEMQKLGIPSSFPQGDNIVAFPGTVRQH